MKRVRELCDNVKCTNIHTMWVPEGEEREKGTEKIFQEIIAKNFPNMGEEPLTQIQQAQRVPYKIATNRWQKNLNSNNGKKFVTLLGRTGEKKRVREGESKRDGCS